MTSIPGHNIVLQQSGAAQEVSHQAQTLKPSPEQAVAQQQISERIENSSVQEFDEAEKLKAKKEKQALRRKQFKEKQKKRKKSQERDTDPDTPGRLLDTMV